MTAITKSWKNLGSKIKTLPKTGWAAAIIILTAIGGYVYYSNVYLPAQAAAGAPALQTATVRQGDLILYASGTGTLISQNNVSFGFGTSGQVTRVNVKVGEQVEAGQVLAELSNTSASLNYNQALRTLAELTSPAAIATAQQNLALAQDNLAAKKKELEYVVSPSVLTWEERLAAAQTALADAQAAANVNSSNEATQKVKDAERTVKLAEANLKSAQASYDSYVKATFTETKTNPFTGTKQIVYYIDATTGKKYTVVYAPTPAEIAAARAAYALAKATVTESQYYLSALNGDEIPATATGSALSQLQAVRDALLSSQTELTNTQLIAPIAGTVMSLDFSVGDIVNGSTAVVSIADLSQPYLEVFLDASDWANVKVGYETQVTFDILPGKVFTGTVTQVDPGLYTEGNTSVVRTLVELTNPGNSFNLPLGTSASVDVIGGRAMGAVLVPVEALRETSPGQYAVFVVENGKPQLRVIEVGIQDLLYAEVKSGLQPGDVVTTGITETQQ